MKKIFYILSVVFLLFSCDEHKVTSIKIHNGDDVLVMEVGEKHTIEVRIEPLKNHIYNTVYWKTSNPNVATVNNGVVTAIYSGTCIITASAGNKTATCEVTVKTLNFDNFNFTKAVAYFFGNASEILGVNTAVLRLYSDGYNIENDGSVSGFGSYFSTEINYPAPNIMPPNGTFTNSTNVQNFTFLPGKIENGYPYGTFFLFTGIDGASGIMVEKGTLNISTDSIFGNFVGENGENIKVKYYNDVKLIDRTLPPPDTLKLGNTVQHYSLLGDMLGNGTSVIRCKIYSANGSGAYLQLDFVVPISAGTIPVGFYKLNNSHQPYSLVEPDLSNGTGTILFENSVTPKEILYGNVDVKKVDDNLKFTIHLVEASGRVIEGIIIY